MDGITKARNSIMAAKEIVISGHINPDGDSVGSLLALGLGLEKLGKRVYMLSCDAIPQKYKKLPGAASIIKKLDRPVELAISVDCSNKEILGRSYRSFVTADEILEIDHHEFRRPFGDVSYVDEKSAAVGEMIYLLLKKLDVRITKEIAHNLMTSIVVETSSFRLPNVRPLTFEVCVDLMNAGVGFYELVDMIFIKGRDEDVDAVPDEMRSIKKVEISILFRESGRHSFRVSLRSKDNINVAAIAERYGGGGHFDVAGCSIPNNRKSVKEFLEHAERLLT